MTALRRKAVLEKGVEGDCDLWSPNTRIGNRAYCLEIEE